MRHIETLAVPRDARILWGQLIGSKAIPRPVRAVNLTMGGLLRTLPEPLPSVSVFADPHDLTRFCVTKHDQVRDEHIVIGMIEVAPCGWLAWTPTITDDEPPTLAPLPDSMHVYPNPVNAVCRVLQSWEWCQRTINNDWPDDEADEDDEDERLVESE